MKGGMARFWLSENIQAFHDWVKAIEQIRQKSPLEAATLTREAAKMFWGGDDDREGGRKALFGDGRMDYMMDRYKNIAQINISGTLVKNNSMWNRYFGLISYDEIRQATLAALQDNSVDGISLMMNTPGGAASGADSMATFFKRAGATKPMFAYVESEMCSGGYYLGAPAEEIYAQRAAMVGSIGVVMVHYDQLKMYQDEGIQPTVFRAGKYKALGSSVEHLDEKAKADIQGRLEDYFSMFNEHVVECRDYSSVEALLESGGEGRVFMAKDAIEVGLIDQLADMEEALEDMSSKAQRKAGKKTVVAARSTISQSARGTEEMPKPAKGFSADQLQALAASGIDPKVASQTEHQGEAAGEERTDEDPNKVEGEQKKEDESETAGEGGEGGRTDAGDATDSEPKQSAPAGGFDLKAILQLSEENGALKARLESLTAAGAGVEQKLADQEQLIDQLSSIVGIAVNNRQVALGFQPSSVDSMTPAQRVELFGELDTQLRARFKPGAASRPSQEAVKAVTNDQTKVQSTAKKLTNLTPR